jgi:hypothetical protein
MIYNCCWAEAKLANKRTVQADASSATFLNTAPFISPFGFVECTRQIGGIPAQRAANGGPQHPPGCAELAV